MFLYLNHYSADFRARPLPEVNLQERFPGDMSGCNVVLRLCKTCWDGYISS